MERNERRQGIICIIMAAFFFSLMTLLVRMAGDLPTMQKAMFRNLVAAVVSFGMLLKKGEIIVLFFSVFSVVVCLPGAFFTYQPMSGRQLLILLLAGVAATGGQLAITAAYTHAPAKEISVFDYSQILFAALWGFLFLGQIPDGYSFLGYAIILAAAVLKLRPAG